RRHGREPVAGDGHARRRPHRRKGAPLRQRHAPGAVHPGADRGEVLLLRGARRGQGRRDEDLRVSQPDRPGAFVHGTVGAGEAGGKRLFRRGSVGWEPRPDARAAAGWVSKTRSISMTVEAAVDDRYILATGAGGAARLALLDQVYGPDAERIMTAIGIPRGGRVADIGCGTGNTTRWLASKVGPEGQITAVDVSADQLAVAQSGAEADGLRNIHFVRASAYDTGLPRNPF